MVEDGAAWTLAALTTAVQNLDARVNARDAWIQSIADAASDHAEGLEACGRDAIIQRARVSELKEELKGGLLSAEAKLGELFTRSDTIMKQYEELFKTADKGLLDLEKADLAMKEALEARQAHHRDLEDRNAQLKKALALNQQLDEQK